MTTLLRALAAALWTTTLPRAVAAAFKREVLSNPALWSSVDNNLAAAPGSSEEANLACVYSLASLGSSSE